MDFFATKTYKSRNLTTFLSKLDHIYWKKCLKMAHFLQKHAKQTLIVYQRDFVAIKRVRFLPEITWESCCIEIKCWELKCTILCTLLYIKSKKPQKYQKESDNAFFA